MTRELAMQSFALATQLTRYLATGVALMPMLISSMDANAAVNTLTVERPNIILITADDYGRDNARLYNESTGIGPTAPTPNLEILAQQGIVYDNAWAMPTCTPSRGALMTGRLPSTSGMSAVIEVVGGTPTQTDPNNPDLLPRQMKNAGYRTAMYGKWHQTPNQPSNYDDPRTSGFDRFIGLMTGFPRGGYYQNSNLITDGVRTGPEPGVFMTKQYVDDALEFMAQADEAAEPYFIWLSFYVPHFTAEIPPKDGVDESVVQLVMDTVGGPYPAVGTIRSNQEETFAFSQAMISYLDTQIGRLMEQVDLSSTYVIFHGDNGSQGDIGRIDNINTVQPPFDPGRSKISIFRNGVEVPFLIAGPDVADTGSRSSAQVNIMDIYATALDLAGINKPAAAKDAHVIPINGPGLTGGLGSWDTMPEVRTFNIAEIFGATPQTGGLLLTVSETYEETEEGRVISDGRFRLLETPVIIDGAYVCLPDIAGETSYPPDCTVDPAVTGEPGVKNGDREVAYQFFDLAVDPYEDNDLLLSTEPMNFFQAISFNRLCAEITRIASNATYYQTAAGCEQMAITDNWFLGLFPSI